MVKISVIIPVYNCEQFIEQGIQSIQEQTMKEIEIICVDDGSTDNSAGIIKSLGERDGRIQLYRQENMGAGAARNLGMSHAHGEFMAFFDADDYYLDADALEFMFSICKEQKVSVCGTRLSIEREGKLFKDRDYCGMAQAVGQNSVLQYKDYQPDYGYCGFIFERSLVLENRIQFPLYRRFQDPVFFVRVMFAAGQFCFTDKTLYVYRAPSVPLRFHKKNTVDLLKGLLDNLEFAVGHGLDRLARRTVERVEEEYADIICHNLSTESLSLLLKIDQFVKDSNICDAEHTIIPLMRVMESVWASESRHEQVLAEKLATCRRIYPYGAGTGCTDFLKYLRKNGWISKVGNILVTSREDNPDTVGGIPVVEAGGYQVQKGDLVILTVTGIYRNEVAAVLEKIGITDYEAV